MHVATECFLFEMQEDLGVKVGERDIFQSSGCFRERLNYSTVKKLKTLNKGMR